MCTAGCWWGLQKQIQYKAGGESRNPELCSDARQIFLTGELSSHDLMTYSWCFRCEMIPFDMTGNNNDTGGPIDEKSNQWFGASLSSSGEDGVIVVSYIRTFCWSCFWESTRHLQYWTMLGHVKAKYTSLSQLNLFQRLNIKMIELILRQTIYSRQKHFIEHYYNDVYYPLGVSIGWDVWTL